VGCTVAAQRDGQVRWFVRPLDDRADCAARFAWRGPAHERKRADPHPDRASGYVDAGCPLHQFGPRASWIVDPIDPPRRRRRLTSTDTGQPHAFSHSASWVRLTSPDNHLVPE
jgi:hypothetical protein